MKQRDAYFDIVKAVAMYMVVVWHVLEKNICVCGVGWGNITVSLILGVNMPVFFTVAGYFAYPTIVECKWRKLLQHLRQYYSPFVAISVLFSILAVCLGIIFFATGSDICVETFFIRRLVYLGIGNYIQSIVHWL